MELKNLKVDIANLTDAQKNELVEKTYNLAYEYEQKYGNCPQCTIAAIQDVFGIIDDSLFKASYGLGAGTGLTSKGSCGAMSAVVMVISALKGRERADFHGGRNEKCYELSRGVIAEFEKKYGGILCNQVQKSMMGKSYDLSKSDEFKAFEEAGGHKDKCPDAVGTAARYVAELIVNGEL